MAVSSPLAADSPTNLPSPAESPSYSKLSASTLLPVQATSNSAGLSSTVKQVVDGDVSAAGASGKPLLAIVTEQPCASKLSVEKKPTKPEQADDRRAEQNQDKDNQLQAEKRLAEANLRADLAWNHAVAVSLLQASFEKCMFTIHRTQVWADICFSHPLG